MDGSSIVVDSKINKGSPSILCQNGKHTTLKCVYHFNVAFMTEYSDESARVAAVGLELGITPLQVLECLEYCSQYPQIV